MKDHTFTQLRRASRHRIVSGAKVIVRVALVSALTACFARDAGAQPSGGTGQWTLNVGANEVYETTDSPGTAVPNISGTGFSTLLNGSLGRTWTLRRGGVSVAANASQFIYDLQGQTPISPNQLAYSFGGNASYQISRRLSWDVGEALSSGYARDLTTSSITGPPQAVLPDADLLAPKSVIFYNTLSTGLSYQLTRQANIRWSVSEQNVAIGPGDDAITLATSVSLSRQAGWQQTLGVTADYSRTLRSATAGSIMGLSGTWARPFGKKLSVSASGGVQGHDVPGQAGVEFEPTVGIGLNFNSHLIVDNDTFSVNIGRSLSQHLGLGALLTQGVTAAYGLSLGPRLSISGGAGYDRNVDPTLFQAVYGRSVNASVRYSFVRSLSLGATYATYVRSPATNHLVSVSLTYGKNWR